jgi:hypothetical protein
MTWSLACILLGVSALRAAAAEPNDDKRQYLIFPVSTQLQKSVLFSANLRYYVLMNGDAVVTKDGHILSKHLDVDRMRKDIGNGLSLDQADAISFRALYRRLPPSHASRLLEVAMNGWASEIGFKNVNYDSVVGSEDKWRSLLRWTEERVGYIKDDVKEEGVGDGRVNVYPVQALLSRYYLDDASCVVDFVNPFDKDFTGTLDEETRKTIITSVKKLDLASKNHVMFSIHYLEGAGRAADRLNEFGGKDLAKELGFATHSVLSRRAR